VTGRRDGLAGYAHGTGYPAASAQLPRHDAARSASWRAARPPLATASRWRSYGRHRRPNGGKRHGWGTPAEAMKPAPWPACHPRRVTARIWTGQPHDRQEPVTSGWQTSN